MYDAELRLHKVPWAYQELYDWALDHIIFTPSFSNEEVISPQCVALIWHSSILALPHDLFIIIIFGTFIRFNLSPLRRAASLDCILKAYSLGHPNIIQNRMNAAVNLEAYWNSKKKYVVKVQLLPLEIFGRIVVLKDIMLFQGDLIQEWRHSIPSLMKLQHVGCPFKLWMTL